MHTAIGVRLRQLAFALHAPASRRHLLHYLAGAHFARFVRIDDKLARHTPLSFLAAFLMSTTAPWQILDALL